MPVAELCSRTQIESPLSVDLRGLSDVPIAWAAVLEGHITVKRAQGKAVREATVAATKAQVQ